MPDFPHSAQPGTDTGNVQASVCLVLLLIALWPLTHRYEGVGGDAGLYAVQALAKIHPNLATDLFLQNNSQDRYTVFSPIYAWCIRWLGLRSAAMTLVIAFKIWLFTATWMLARELFDRRSAFLSTALVMIISGAYGGYSVFKYAEDWLTARTLAEPMVITAVWLYFRNFRIGAVLVAFAALLVHPLIALPGLALLAALWLPASISAAGAALGVLAALGAALYALNQPLGTGMLTVMDADWLEVVRGRSVFLFPQFWHFRDWAINIQPFVSLAISAIVLRESRIQRFCIAVALVAATGLVIGLIASTIGPVGLLLQGQAWRWVWIARFTAVILLGSTLLKLWQDEKCGPFCAVLAVLAWSFPPVVGVTCLGMVLVLRSARHHVSDRAAVYFRLAAIVMAGVALAWAVAGFWSIASSTAPESGLESILMVDRRNFFGLGVIWIALAGLFVYWLNSTTSRAVPAALSAILLVCCLLVYPGAFRVYMREGSAEQIAEFSDWRRWIAPDDAVYVLPAHNSAAFSWFTLQRPSYLTVDQSAGVVFSRATALEVRRRSNTLAPLMDPDWKLLSGKVPPSSGGQAAGKKRALILTRDGLIAICSDPKLKFVVARENLGFDPITHTHVGNWKDWNLYDCRRVNGGVPQA